MKKIIDYTIVQCIGAANMIKTVSEFMGIGWQPQGGLTVIDTPNTTFFYQAMVKYEEEPTTKI